MVIKIDINYSAVTNTALGFSYALELLIISWLLLEIKKKKKNSPVSSFWENAFSSDNADKGLLYSF